MADKEANSDKSSAKAFASWPYSPSFGPMDAYFGSGWSWPFRTSFSPIDNYVAARDTYNRLRDAHYSRNAFNQTPTYDEASANWTRLPIGQSLYHLHGAASNQKFVSPDGHSEAVFDASGDLVTDPQNLGTYNYSAPTEKFMHALKDVAPYSIWGNSPDDKTSFLNRIVPTDVLSDPEYRKQPEVRRQKIVDELSEIYGYQERFQDEALGSGRTIELYRQLSDVHSEMGVLDLKSKVEAGPADVLGAPSPLRRNEYPRPDGVYFPDPPGFDVTASGNLVSETEAPPSTDEVASLTTPLSTSPRVGPDPREAKELQAALEKRQAALNGIAEGAAGGLSGSVLQGFASAGPAGAVMSMLAASEGFQKALKPVNELLQKAANVLGAVFEPFAALLEDVSKALTPTLEALRPIVATLMELSPWFQFLKVQVELLGGVMQGVAGFLTDGVLAFLQFLKKALNGMGVSWKSLDKAISALKNPVDALSKAFAAVSANIPNDYDLLNLRIFQAGGLRFEGSDVGSLGQEAIDRLVDALHQLTDPIETVAVWLEKLVKKIKKLIDKLDGGDDGLFGTGYGATSSGESVGPAQSRTAATIIYGGVHVAGVTDPESFFRKLERVRTRHETVQNGTPRSDRRRR